MSATDERIGDGYDVLPGAVPPDEEAAAVLAELRAKTVPVGDLKNVVRSTPAYNHPDRWFMRHDGHIVKLPGDPQSVSHYTETKGYHLLTEPEVQRWLKARPSVVREQRKRADLITTIRRIVREHAKEVTLDESRTPLDRVSTDRLQEKLEQMRTALPGVVVFTEDDLEDLESERQRADAERDRADTVASDVQMGGGAQIEAMIARSKQSGRGAVSG